MHLKESKANDIESPRWIFENQFTALVDRKVSWQKQFSFTSEDFSPPSFFLYNFIVVQAQEDQSSSCGINRKCSKVNSKKHAAEQRSCLQCWQITGAQTKHLRDFLQGWTEVCHKWPGLGDEVAVVFLGPQNYNAWPTGLASGHSRFAWLLLQS